MCFTTKLEKRRCEKKTCLCIGIDPDEDDINNFINSEKKNDYKNVKNNLTTDVVDIIEIGKDVLFNKESYNFLKKEDIFFYFFNHFCFYIINTTKEYALVYKMNFAFYIPYGSIGINVLKNVFDYLKHLNIPTILDMKINDIGNTIKQYRTFIFEYLKSDSCTVNIYMGTNMLKNVCYNEEKKKYHSVFVLIKTSNDDSFLFQNQLMLNDKQAYLIMAEEAYKVSKELKLEENKEFIGFVVGANCSEEMKIIRQKFPDIYFLIPGIGAQNGDLKKIFNYGYYQNYEKLLINVGRAITKNADPRKAAEEYYNQINQIIKNI
ncbi:orotidine 5'-phosphate decarboxylase, putative [Hepatocystis sp. ex Piliocolobus tephrosceles]|nr:orotidine 5'-phosphate decarboxylase, putative [Hepatocystis sp. ex Piliocolobus tephrosceles]